MRAAGPRREVIEVLDELIDAHLANSGAVPAADVDATLLALFLSRDEDVVPLVELGISDLLVELRVRLIELNLEALLVKIEHDTVAVVDVLLGDGDNDGLSGRNEERPLATKMLYKNGNKALNRTKNGSVDNNGSSEAGLQRVLLPGKILLIELVLGIVLTSERRPLALLLSSSLS